MPGRSSPRVRTSRGSRMWNNPRPARDGSSKGPPSWRTSSSSVARESDMLTFYDHDARGTRRSFLRVGGAAALGAGGPGLVHLAALHAHAEEPPGVLTGKSVIFLFLHGGPSQIETFDPKMDRPEGVRSATGEVATTIPGVTFGGTFPQLAARADRPTVLRPFAPAAADHNLKPLVGRDSFGATPGALLARVAGPNHPRTGLPTHVALFPRAVDPTTRPGTTAFGRFEATGPLSSAYAPFDPSRGEGAAEGLRLRLPRERLDDRRRLHAVLDAAPRHLEPARATGSAPRRIASSKGGWPRRSTWPAKTLASSPATTRRRWCGPTRSARRGRITRTMSTTRSRWASCCSWPAGFASAGAAS